ncbi:MAG: hypothetical protein ACKVHO_24785, partial [Verrucomicrobiia bacterium]
MNNTPTPLIQPNRRQFMSASAIAAGATMLPSALQLDAAPGETRSTKHFWYRVAPKGPYIDSQRDNKAFGFGAGKISLSEDNGKTWPHSAEFPNAENVTFS